MVFMQYSFLIFFLKAYVVGTHLNCLDKKSVSWCIKNKLHGKYMYFMISGVFWFIESLKHIYIILTPLNPLFI